MAFNCSTDFVKIFAQARVKIGGETIQTPNIISINVSKSRGKPVTTASVQFLYDRDSADLNSSTTMTLYFWNAMAFRGYIKKMNISPSPRVAGEIIIRVQAEDAMHKLTNKRFTRRQKSNGIGPVVFISSIYKRTSLGFDDPTDIHDKESGSSPDEQLCFSTNMAELFNYLKGGETNTCGKLHAITKAADDLVDIYGSGGSIGGLTLHDHTSLDTTGPHAGGPAAAVFGAK